MKNDLNFFVPIDAEDYLEKASKQTGRDKYNEMFLQGIASDNTKDSDEEELQPDGFVLDRFLSEGLINYEHLAKSGGPKYIIGEPVEAYAKNNKFFIKAKLWKGKQMAEDLWDTLLIMRENGSKKKLGWSIEGKALERDKFNSKKITKAQIHHCALTFMPKNYNTFADIVKGEQKEDFIKSEVENPMATNYMFEFEKSGKKYVVTKDFKVEEKKEDEEEKAVTTESAKPLRKESLDSDVKNIIAKSLKSGRISPEKAYNLIKSFYI